ncbi:unnamed protein product [Moneuplotes crassus]|uniref:LITAF domain-containing protein n=1 Tax=Euplotes crassus TaxID=5936 RepID=A0AAD2D358_EUPCR|nr:unnamed protein product [Moneuplotes crassus]
MQAPQPGGYIGQQHVQAPNLTGATESVQVVCPHCKAPGMTNTRKEASSTQWILCVICFLICFPCTCSPFYFPNCYKITHTCQFCNNVIGSNKN